MSADAVTAHRGRWPTGREARDTRQHGDGTRTTNEVGSAHFRISGIINSTSKVYQIVARYNRYWRAVSRS